MAPHADRLHRYSLYFQPSSLPPQRSQTPKGQKEPLRCAMLQYSASEQASFVPLCTGASGTVPGTRRDPDRPRCPCSQRGDRPCLTTAPTGKHSHQPEQRMGQWTHNLQMKMAEEPRSAKRHVLRDGSHVEHSWPSRGGSRRGRIEPHLTDEETEAQGGKVTCPRPHVR